VKPALRISSPELSELAELALEAAAEPVTELDCNAR
jgi:hypothetical protein